MKIFFDTEFYEDGKTIELISIGMVREDGASLYFETLNAHRLCAKSEWLVNNVEKYLTGENVASLDDIAAAIKEFAGDKPEFWAYYADYDWVALCQLYGTMMDLPNGWPMFCMDIKQIAVMKGYHELSKQVQIEMEHHALADAIWNWQAHKFLMGQPWSDQ